MNAKADSSPRTTRTLRKRMRRSGQSSEQIHRTIEGLYAAVLDDSEWTTALRRVYQLVTGSGMLVMVHNSKSGEIERYDAVDMDPEMFAAYKSYWVQHDDRIVVAQNVPVGSLMTEQSLLGKKVWVRSALYNEFLRGEDLPYILAAWLQKSSNRTTAISLQRSHSIGPYGATDADIVKRIIPHLTRALEVRDRLSLADYRARTLLEVMDRLPFTVFLLDHKGRVLEASEKGRLTMSEQDGLWCDQGHLRCSDPEDDRIFQGVLGKTAAANWEKQGGTIQVRRPLSNRQLSILVTPILEATTWLVANNSALLVVAFDPGSVSISMPSLQSMYALTMAEARLTCLLVSGTELGDVAAALGISMNTAKSHLKSIFDKTDCHSQAALTRTVLTGPAMFDRHGDSLMAARSL